MLNFIKLVLTALLSRSIAVGGADIPLATGMRVVAGAPASAASSDLVSPVGAIRLESHTETPNRAIRGHGPSGQNEHIIGSSQGGDPGATVATLTQTGVEALGAAAVTADREEVTLEIPRLNRGSETDRHPKLCSLTIHRFDTHVCRPRSKTYKQGSFAIRTVYPGYGTGTDSPEISRLKIVEDGGVTNSQHQHKRAWAPCVTVMQFG